MLESFFSNAPSSSGSWSVVGFLGGALVVLFGLVLGIYMGRSDRRRRDATYKKRIQQIGDVVDRYNMTPEDRATILSLIPEPRAVDIVRVDRDVSVVTYIFLAGGLIGAILALYTIARQLLGKGNLLIGMAYGAETPAAPKVDVGWMLPWILALIMGVMAITFLGSVATIFLTKDSEENQTKLKNAGDIVKTFGGFFTGIATTLLTST
jgi:hypothetical protein